VAVIGDVVKLRDRLRWFEAPSAELPLEIAALLR